MHLRTLPRQALLASLLTLPFVSGCADDATDDHTGQPAGDSGRVGGVLRSDTPPATGANSLSPGTGSGVGTGSDVGTGTPSAGSDSNDKPPAEGAASGADSTPPKP
jgi:hypothetical protein